MRRSPVGLREVTTLDNLALAYWRAARGKRERDDVRRFGAILDVELARLREEILSGTMPLGQLRSFRVFDPKARVIHAPSFRERVLHHALMEHMGPVLDNALIDDSFACRTGKGTLAAVLRARQNSRRFPWYVKVDVRAYFASIDHEVVKRLLRRRFKAPGLLTLCDRIIDSFEVKRGKGLPIGALTSQYFANDYLATLDRFLLEDLRVCAMARYMDDVVWWCRDRAMARESLVRVRNFVEQRLLLRLHDRSMVQRVSCGLPFLGFRVFPGRLLLSRRRKNRYARARRVHETAYRLGLIDARELQAAYASAYAVTAHADAAGWRRAELARHGSVDA